LLLINTAAVATCNICNITQAQFVKKASCGEGLMCEEGVWGDSGRLICMHACMHDSRNNGVVGARGAGAGGGFFGMVAAATAVTS
jgi:hypothetical protein